MVNVLLIGNGGREHVIGEVLVRDGASLRAFMAKKNPAIAQLTNNKFTLGDLTDFVAITQFAKTQQIDFAIVGPEAPLAVGITNALKSHGIPTVGPTIECAQLEASKVFARSLLDQYKIPSNIQFQIFSSMEGIPAFIHQIGLEKVVVKPDGLTGGKGVKVWGDHLHSEQDIYQYCEELLRNKNQIVIEEKLEGEEFTLMAFVDGHHVVGMPVVQDNKRAFNDDKGPNTGGMGSISMPNHRLPFLNQDDIEYALNQMELSIKALMTETQSEYKGILYGQFMKTKSGIKLIEFNIRFGDPEAMNVLPLLQSNFVHICQSILDGSLPKTVNFGAKATVCKYLVPEGYPDNPKTHAEISIDTMKLHQLGVQCYYASVSEEQNRLYTSTSRAIAVLGIADEIDQAEKLAEIATHHIRGPLYHRSDIGTKLLLEKRWAHMASILRG